jgi:hypothetical protein
MKRDRLFLRVTVAALLLPLLLYAVSAGALYPSLKETLSFGAFNWAYMAAPQVVVVVVAAIYPTLRGRFALIALISLSVLLLGLQSWVWWENPDDGPLAWTLYIPLSATVLLIAGLASAARGYLARGL